MDSISEYIGLFWKGLFVFVVIYSIVFILLKNILWRKENPSERSILVFLFTLFFSIATTFATIAIFPFISDYKYKPIDTIPISEDSNSYFTIHRHTSHIGGGGDTPIVSFSLRYNFLNEKGESKSTSVLLNNSSEIERYVLYRKSDEKPYLEKNEVTVTSKWLPFYKYERVAYIFYGPKNHLVEIP